MPIVELSFPVFGTSLPSDHGYGLYAGLSRLVPRLHQLDAAVRIGPVRGVYQGQGIIQLDSRFSRVRLRMAPETIPLLLPLAGKAIDVCDHHVRLGVPQVRGLVPAPNLMARMVAIKASSPKTDPADKTSRDPALTKRYLDPSAFLEAVRRDLAQKKIAAQADLPLVETGPHTGQPRRRVLRVRGRTIVGFSVVVQGLTAEESVRLQEEGVGGRGKMGCGFFVPAKEGR
jgi:hypothetical protein